MNLIKTPSFTLSIYSQGNPNAEKLAVVIPGKLDSKDFAHIRSHVEFLASKGFYAVTFDPPGTWESEGYGNAYTMSNYLKAIDEVIEYFGGRPTLLVGHSRGGKNTIIAGSTNPQILAYVAIMCTLPNKEDIKPVDEEWKERGYDITFRALPPGTGPKIKELRLPYSFYEDQIKYFVTEEIKNCQKPKMFVMGKKDTIVPPEKLLGTYNQLSEPKELHEVDSDHDYWYHPEIIEQINQLLGDFIKRYL